MGSANASRKSAPRGRQVPASLVAARQRREEKLPGARRKPVESVKPVRAGEGTARRERPAGRRAKADLRPVAAARQAPRAATGGLSGTGYTVLGVVLAMFLYGMVMIFSASSGLAFQVYGSSYYFLVRQAVWFGVGIMGMAALAYTDYHRLVRWSPALVAICLAALAAVPIIGTETYGSKRSIAFGPVVFQPSEFAKIALILFAVHVYGRRDRKPESWREIFFPVFAVTSLACLLILIEPDLGSAIIAGISVYAVLFFAGAPLHRLLIMGLAGVGATGMFIMTSGYRKARFLAFLNPWAAPEEGGFHIIQSMVALGSGSVSGLGLGMSRQKFFYLPNAHTDFVFSIIGEELGLLGTLTVLALFAALLFLGFKVARGAPDRTGRILAISITFTIIVQALINMGAATGIMPITGITLPFFSYGGSSLVVCMGFAGILINISRQRAALAPPRDERKKGEGGDMRGRNRRPYPPSPRPGRGTRIA